MKKRTRRERISNLRKHARKIVRSKSELWAEARKILDGVFINDKGQRISGHELDKREQENVVGHVYLQMVMRLASQRAGYLDADGNPTPKAIKAHQKMFRYMGTESSNKKTKFRPHSQKPLTIARIGGQNEESPLI